MVRGKWRSDPEDQLLAWSGEIVRAPAAHPAAGDGARQAVPHRLERELEKMAARQCRGWSDGQVLPSEPQRRERLEEGGGPASRVQIGQDCSYNLCFRIRQRQTRRSSEDCPVGKRLYHVGHDENYFVEVATLF
jgi:hypothetical protein